jgi:hypothetical protein
MASVVCTWCRSTVSLPDPWPHSHYRCPYCLAPVPLEQRGPDATPPRLRPGHEPDANTAPKSDASGPGHRDPGA